MEPQIQFVYIGLTQQLLLGIVDVPNLAEEQNMGAITQAISERRSIRKFLDKPVNEEIIAQIITAGQQAPSRGNSQPWHFVVVNDKSIKAELYEACYNQQLIVDAPFCIVVLGIIDPRKNVPDRTEELVQTGAFGREVKDFADHILDDWDLAELKVDAALNASIPATQMSLAALDFGLGSCWVKLAKDDSVIDVVGANDRFYHAGTLAFGYPDQSPKARPRLPLTEIVSHNKVGKPYF